jgi:hypothetical protein
MLNSPQWRPQRARRGGKMKKTGANGLGILAGIVAGLALLGCNGGSNSSPPSGSGGVPSSSGPASSGGVLGTGGVVLSGGVASSGGAVSTGPGGATSAGGIVGRGGAAAGSGGVLGTGGGAIRDAGAEVAEVGASSSCPSPPAGAPADAVTALNTENAARVAMGVPCASLVLALCTSALNHCNYYTTNQGSAICQAASAHSEIAGCPQFTGADPGARIKAAGYTGNGWSEDMAFRGDPAGAVKTFIDSVYHRTAVLSPWYRDMGYGGGTGCDTIDFGPGTATAKTIAAFYPYDGQVGVPLSFNGANEGPTPPVPTTGWPSGYPITLYGQGITAGSHQIVVDGTTTLLAHQWLDGDASLGSTAKVLYTDAPLTANTTYRVTIAGTTTAGSVSFDWTFTTGAANPGGGRRG